MNASKLTDRNETEPTTQKLRAEFARYWGTDLLGWALAYSIAQCELARGLDFSDAYDYHCDCVAAKRGGCPNFVGQDGAL